MKTRKLDSFFDVKQAIDMFEHLLVFELKRGKESEKIYEYHDERNPRIYPVLLFYDKEKRYLDSTCSLIQFEIEIVMGIDQEDISSRSARYKDYLNSLYLIDWSFAIEK